MLMTTAERFTERHYIDEHTAWSEWNDIATILRGYLATQSGRQNDTVTVPIKTVPRTANVPGNVRISINDSEEEVSAGISFDHGAPRCGITICGTEGFIGNLGYSLQERIATSNELLKVVRESDLYEAAMGRLASRFGFEQGA